ncbi:MAG: phospho-N-acetylmuramoyl-pentapeptide-transferase [Bdellovibrionota bacterium]
MLYNWLYTFHQDYSFFNVFKYQSFKAMSAFLFSFFLVLFIQPRLINWLKKQGLKGQPIRENGPKSHQAKSGTPTMGGLSIIFAIIVSMFLFTDITNLYVILSIFVLISYAILGFVDDWRKVTKQNTKGVSGKVKIFWQVLIATIFASVLVYNGFSTELHFPFFKHFYIDLGYFFIPFAVLVIVGTSNAANLTDGLDGLAIGPIMTVALLYVILTYIAGHSELAKYLSVFYLPQAGELSILLTSLIATGLGFLWYNTFPATVFMGDLGSLSLGAFLGAIAVLIKQELLLVIAAGVFVVEALSVIIQVYYFRLSGGKRVFKMAPIHHHFELKGLSEPKLIVRFWIVSILLAVISLATLKLR